MKEGQVVEIEVEATGIGAFLNMHYLCVISFSSCCNKTGFNILHF
jgi:hypothetical protein